MKRSRVSLPAGYTSLLGQIKTRIQQAQTRAILSVNAELVRLYWDIGQMIDQRQQKEGWGTTVIPRLARELHNQLPEMKGFSERNIKRMLAFHRAYREPDAIVPQPVAQLVATSKLPQPVAKLAAKLKVPQPVAQISFAKESLLWSIPWGHHAVLMEKVESLDDRRWYMQQTLADGWSRNVLLLMIDSSAHRRQGRAVTNFDQLLPAPQSDLAQQTLKDPQSPQAV